MGFFARRQPRQFNPKPRYYDERKDRLRIIERPEGVDEIPFENKEKYRQRLRENWDLRRSQSAGKSDGFLKRIGLSLLILAAIGLVTIKLVF